VLNKLKPEEIELLIRRAVSDKEKGLGCNKIEIEDSTIAYIANFCDGDSRIAYNILDIAVNSFISSEKNADDGNFHPVILDIPYIENIIQRKALLYDKDGEEHFNLISALHKSMRGSDPDAAVYWTIRMIESGEEPLYILRRMVRFASEDIGLADPNALKITISAKESFEFIGRLKDTWQSLKQLSTFRLRPKAMQFIQHIKMPWKI